MARALDSKHLPPAEWFDRWWRPMEFLQVVAGHNDAVPANELFNRPELKKLCEAYAAALFSTIRAEGRDVAVWLESGTFPDFKLSENGKVLDFELVEADRAGRKRGDEYKAEAERVQQGLSPSAEFFDPAEEEAAALPAIEHAIALKARKKYRPPPNLLVYTNFQLFKDMSLTTLDVANLTHKWKQDFASIWLLWGAYAVRCYPNPCKMSSTKLKDLLKL